MPITPRFWLRQDDDFLYVHIRVPYVRVSDMEFEVDGCEFSFWCKPYLLRLKLPCPLVEDERAKAVYDPNKVREHMCGRQPRRTRGWGRRGRAAEGERSDGLDARRNTG